MRLFIILLLFPCFVFAQKEDLKPLDAMLTNYSYPFEVKFINIENLQQQLKMAYMDIIPPNYNNKNIVLLHGKNFNGAYWKTTIDTLMRSGYRIIVPDQVGFGKSSKPSNFQYSFHQLAYNTKLLLDSIGITKAIILGHSMGGMLATRFALMYPMVTEKLILENPIGLEDYKALVPYQTIEQGYQNELKQDYQKIKQYQLTNYYNGKWKPAYEEWAKLLAAWTISDDYPLLARTAALTADMIFTQPVVYEFKNIKCPTLLIIGTRDRTAIGKNLASPSVQKTMGLSNWEKSPVTKFPDPG